MGISIARPEVRVVLALGTQSATATVLAALTARWLGPSDRGILVTFIATSTFLMLVGSAGVPTGGRVLLADRLSVGHYLSIARTLCLVHVVWAGTAGLGVLWLAGALPDPGVGLLFVAAAVSQLYGYFQREGIHGVGHHVTAVSGDVLSATVQIVLVCAAYRTGELNIDVACAAVLVGSVAQNIYLSIRLHSLASRGPTSADAMTFGAVVRFSSPAAIGVFSQAFVYRGDRLLLAAMTTTTAVGIYSVAGTLGELLGVISFGVSQVVFRRMASREMGTWYPRVRRVTLLLTMCSCVVMALAVPFIVLGVLGPDYRGAIQISYVLIAASLPFASYHLDVAALCGLGRLKSARRVNAVAAVFLLVCCVVTIPAMQAWGATISSALTYCVMAVYARWEMARNVPRHHGREAVQSATGVFGG